VELTESFENLKSSALKLELAFKGCFSAYLEASYKLNNCGKAIQKCDMAYTALSDEYLQMREKKPTGYWLGLPGWAWVIIGIGAGMVGTSIVIGVSFK